MNMFIIARTLQCDVKITLRRKTNNKYLRFNDTVILYYLMESIVKNTLEDLVKEITVRPCLVNAKMAMVNENGKHSEKYIRGFS
jgi:hypothetical protein